MIVILSIGGIVSIEGKWDCLVEGVMISIGEIKDFHIERFIIIREYQSFIELINILICDRFEMI